MNKIVWVLIGLVVLGPGNARQAELEYLEEARGYLASGETNAAVIQLKNLLKEAPENAEGRFLLATAHAQLGDGESAIKEFQRAKELGVSRERWIVPLAKAYLMTGKVRQLVEEIHPESGITKAVQADLYAILALAETALKNPLAAGKNLDKALELNRESVDVLLAAARLAGSKRQLAEASKYAREALDIRENIAEAWMILGEVNRAEGNNQSALENFNQALTVNPAYIPAKLARVGVYIGLRNFDAAEQDLEQVVSIAGEVPLALYFKGAIDYERKSFAEAENSLHKVINMVPDHWPSLLLLGAIAYHKNQFETAYSHLSRYVTGVPGDLRAIKLLAATTLKTHQIRKTLDLIEPIRAQFPDDPQLLAILGSAYLEQGKYDQATEVLSKAAQISPDTAAIHTQLALSHLKSGSFDQAVAELETAVDLGKDVSQADVLLMLTLIQQKKFDQAIETGLKLFAKQPANPMPANLLGAAYFGKGDADSARNYWIKALDIQPGFKAAATNLARLEINQKKFDAANTWYQEILKHNAEDIGALLGLVDLARIRKDTDAMEKWMDSAMKASPEDIQQRTVLADYLVSRKDFSGAKRIIDELKLSHPDNFQLLAKSGTIDFATGEFESAVKSFQSLVDRHPDNSQLHFLLAQSWFKAGSKDKAKAEWEKVLKLDPANFSAAAFLVQLALDAKQTDEAIKIARELQSKAPKRAIGFQLEGDVMRALNDQAGALAIYRKGFTIEANSALAQQIFLTARATGDQKGGFESMLRWIAEYPDDFSARMLLGMAYIEDTKDPLAIEVYEHLVEIQPQNVIVLNNLAWLYQRNGDSRAVEMAERALQVGSNNAEVIDTAGWVLMLNGQLERSLVLLRQALEKAPKIDAIQVHYAQALIKAGRQAEARTQLENLLAGNREFPERAEAEELLKQI